jgi:DNA polymerase I
MKKPKLVIVDGNSLGYAAHGAMALKTGELETQAVFGVLKSAREIAVEYPDYAKIWLWDGRAQWRFDLLPEYKSNREDSIEKVAAKRQYEEQKPYIHRALSALGMRQITVTNKEADDMAGYLVGSLAPSYEHIELITGDTDWLQLVRENVGWRDWRDDAKWITLKNFAARTGYATPLAYLEAKCLIGDSSDKIPPVGGIGKGTAPQFLETWGSLRHFFNAVDSGEYVPASRASKTAKSLHPEQQLASPAGRAAFARNLRLMQLIKQSKPDPTKVINRPGAFNKEALAEVCEELAFVSILRTLDKFVQPFQTH